MAAMRSRSAEQERPERATQGARDNWTAVQMLLLASTLILVVGLLYFARVVFIPVAIGLYLTLLLWPLQRVLSRRVPRTASILVVALLVLAVIGVLGACIWYAGSVTLGVFTGPQSPAVQLYEKARSAFAQMGLPQQWLPALDGPGPLVTVTVEEPAGAPAPAPEVQAAAQAPAQASRLSAAMLDGAVAFLTSGLGIVVGVLGTLGLALMLMVLIMSEERSLERRTLRVLGEKRAGAIADVLHQAGSKCRRQLVARTISGLLNGVLMGLLCWGLGVPSPWAWAALTYLLNYVPYLGFYVSAAPPLLLAFSTLGAWHGLMLLGGMVVIETLVSNLLDPILEGRAMRLSPPLVLVSVIFWTWLWGAAGALLCSPLTAAVVVVLRHIKSTQTAGRLLSDGE